MGEGKLASVTLLSTIGGFCTVRSGEKMVTIPTKVGEEINLDAMLARKE